MLAVITHQKGSWKWQDRYELAEYQPVTLKSGKRVYRKVRSINEFITPAMRRKLIVDGIHVGSPHMKALNLDVTEARV